MKKSTKTALIASAVVLSACVGTLALVGCGEKKVDPYANMTPTYYQDFKDYISSSDMSFIGVSAEYSRSTGKRYENFSIQYRTTTQGLIAHCYIDCVVPANNNILEIKGNVWLQDNRLYIDNGKDKYWVTYAGSTYASAKVEDLKSESQIFNKYVAFALVEAAPSSNDKILSDVKSTLENNVLYKSTKDADVYYKVDYTTKEKSSSIKLHFKNLGIVEYESSYTLAKDNSVTNQSVHIEQLSGEISRPGKDEDWTKGE